jgi:hypothetical protein
MSIKRIVIIAAAVAAVAGGSAVAIAHTASKEDEQAVLDAAAKQLNVTPEALRDALGDAIDAQIDQAVKDGRLTQEQADALKRRRLESGRVLGLGPGGPRGHHGAGGRGFGCGLMSDVAKALGITERQLFNRLHNGRTVAQIARAEGKSLDAVKAAVKAAATKRLDQALQDGEITDTQRDEMAEHLDEHIERLGEMGGRRHGPGRGGPPGMP